MSRASLTVAAVLVVLATCVPSRADSMSYGFTSNLSGSYKNTSVTGSFTFNPTTNTISGGSLVFNGSSIFAGLGTVTLSSIIGKSGNLVFTYLLSVFNAQTHKTDKLDLQIFVTSKGAYATFGYVCESVNCATYGSSNLSLRVSEGGGTLTYLLLAALVISGSLCTASRKRRSGDPAASQS